MGSRNIESGPSICRDDRQDVDRDQKSENRHGNGSGEGSSDSSSSVNGRERGRKKEKNNGAKRKEQIQVWQYRDVLFLLAHKLFPLFKCNALSVLKCMSLENNNFDVGQSSHKHISTARCTPSLNTSWYWQA
jgi:hypothetical protein